MEGDDRAGMGRLRWQLTVVAALVLAAILVVAALLVVLLFQRSVEATADDVSRARALDLAAAVEGGTLSPRLTDVGDDSVAQVVGAGGRVLASSANLGDAGPITGRSPTDGAPAAYDLEDVRDDDETEDFRVWAVRAQGADGPAVVYVGHSTEATRETVASLVVALTWGLPLALVAASGLLWLLIGRTLRPVAVADRRQRVFVADAAHELQSPLAAFRTSLEVALARGGATDWPRTARGLLRDGARMEALVRDLLFLARQDDRSDQRRSGHRLVDLDDVVLEEARRLRATARVEIDTTAVSAAPVLGSPGDLGRLVRNLLANADRHAATRVGVALTVADGTARLVVSDDGPGVAPEDREAVFDRFFRGDVARGHQSGATGLGLAIVRSVAERHGGTVTVEDAAPGAVFVVSLPAA